MAYFSEDFGKKVRAYRKLKNLSQEKLAENLDVAMKTINQWENGKAHPKQKSFTALCKFLEIPESELLYHSPIQENSFLNQVNNICTQISPTRHKQVIEILKTFVE